MSQMTKLDQVDALFANCCRSGNLWDILSWKMDEEEPNDEEAAVEKK